MVSHKHAHIYIYIYQNTLVLVVLMSIYWISVHIHSNMLRKLDFGIYTGVLISILEILINIYIFDQYIFGIL